MHRVKHYWLLLLLCCGISCAHAFPQSVASQSASGPCSMPSFGAIVNDSNIFSEQQEEWLGEILAPDIERQFKIVSDPENDYLQKMGERLLAQLPKSNIHFRFTIIDLPENNSFGIPGGNIYISRRIITLARSEDELAGLLGHEIGHIITRQPAIDITHDLTGVLGVSSLGDRKDVVEKWNRLLDLFATKRISRSVKREEAEQLIADRIAIYAMSRAGYQPSSYIDFFDRLVQTRGNKGSFWTDLFGRTSHDSKRLRELVRNAAPLAQNCIASQVPNGNEQFLRWQKAVIASDFVVTKEALPGLLSKQKLDPPLRSDLRNLRFSPDGKYLVAQDENSIYVLTASPVTNLFRVDTPDTHEPQFTPDSRAIVFYDKELRVQKWDVDGKRIFVCELALSTRCIETRLSHSGEVLACLDQQLQPKLIDVNTSSVIYTGKKLHEATQIESLVHFLAAAGEGEPVDLFAMRFSPDDHYFLAGHENSAFAYDLKRNAEIEISKNVRDLTSNSFTFLSSDEIAGYAFLNGKYAIHRARFPAGEVVDSLPWSYVARLEAAEKGDYLLLLQTGDPAVRVLKWNSMKIPLMYKKPGFAIYGDIFAGETAGGEIGIYNVSDRRYLGGIDLPNGLLSSTTASAFSPDGKWLALSQKTRGAVWNLTTGERTFLTRGFQGAFFEGTQLFAKFPKQGNQSAAVFKLDTSSKTLVNLYDLKSEGKLYGPEDGALYWQQRDLLLRGSRLTSLANTSGKNKKDSKSDTQFLVEAFDIRTNKKLWERKPRKHLPYLVHSREGKTVTVVVGNYQDMKAEAQEDPLLSAKLNAMVDENRRKASYIVEALDDTTGKELGKVLVDTGNLSFKVIFAVTIGDRVLVSDTDHRTLVYSLKTGEQKGVIAGFWCAVSGDGSKILVEDGKAKADLYDLTTLQPLQHFEFPFPLIFAELSRSGENLIALTSDQTIYRLKLDASPRVAGVKEQ